MSLYDIPPEINYNIITKLHPYRLNEAYCRVNTDFLQQCEVNKYDLLQIWCYPNRSIVQLRNAYPNLSWRTVVELSLIFHPIPESVSFYDSFTLTFQSIVNGNKDMAVYFYDHVMNYLEYEHRYQFPTRGLLFTLSVCLHCYKYNMDIFDDLSVSSLSSLLEKNEVYIDVLFTEFKAAMKFRRTKAMPGNKITSFHDNDYYLAIILYNSDIFTYDELCEFIAIMNVISTNTGMRTCYLGMIGRDMDIDQDNQYILKFDSIHKLGLDVNLILSSKTIMTICKPYIPDINALPVNAPVFPLTLSTSFYGKVGIVTPGLADIINIRNRFRDLLRLLTDPFQKSILCITYGLFDEYFKLRDAGLKLEPKQFNIMPKSFKVNGENWIVAENYDWEGLESVSSPDVLANLLNSVGGYMFNSSGFISCHSDLAEIIPRGFDISYLLNPINYDISIEFTGVSLNYHIQLYQENLENYYVYDEDEMME